jgi:hypothetical protein
MSSKLANEIELALYKKLVGDTPRCSGRTRFPFPPPFLFLFPVPVCFPVFLQFPVKKTDF